MRADLHISPIKSQLNVVSLAAAAVQRSAMSEDWPAQNSELWPIEKITPYARNSRTHSDEQVAQIAASIREWGWTVLSD